MLSTEPPEGRNPISIKTLFILGDRRPKAVFTHPCVVVRCGKRSVLMWDAHTRTYTQNYPESQTTVTLASTFTNLLTLAMREVVLQGWYPLELLHSLTGRTNTTIIIYSLINVNVRSLFGYIYGYIYGYI